MSADYEAITHFVQTRMVDATLPVAPLSRTRSSIRNIIRLFDERGWDVVDVGRPGDRLNRQRITSPDGNITLNMAGGKVFRHPPHTETICRRKHLTKRLLELAGLPVPVGSEFGPEEKDIAVAYFGLMPKPVVVKPTDARSSQGVTVGVADMEEFEAAWRHALSEGRQGSSVMLEQFVRGVELRAFVIGGDVAGVLARVQTFVVGDGRSSIAALVEERDAERSVNCRAKMFVSEVNWDFAKARGFEPQTVPHQGQIVFLNPFNFPTIGASIVDVTDWVNDEIRDLAVRANAAIPGLEISGVDLLVGDLEDESTANVIEINTAAGLDMHRYPTHGESRMVDESIVDYFHGLYKAEERK